MNRHRIHKIAAAATMAATGTSSKKGGLMDVLYKHKGKILSALGLLAGGGLGYAYKDELGDTYDKYIKPAVGKAGNMWDSALEGYKTDPTGGEEKSEAAFDLQAAHKDALNRIDEQTSPIPPTRLNLK
jgi:hypothetical protein